MVKVLLNERYDPKGHSGMDAQWFTEKVTTAIQKALALGGCVTVSVSVDGEPGAKTESCPSGLRLRPVKEA